MQQIINAKERRKAFWKFFLFFLLAVVAILGAVFFNFQMPRAENKILRNEMAGYGQSAGEKQQFAALLLRAKNMLDSLDKQPEPAREGYDGKLGQVLDELKKMSANDELNNTIIAGFDGYRFYKKRSMSVAKGEGALQDCQDDLETAKNKIQELNLKMINCGCK